ncbi:MAG: DUF6249 domain-containing protein [Verrucomicrobiales bacterium]|nr:DUF6249 domain-containing protein [Verrucomicrobiales bacterium]
MIPITAIVLGCSIAIVAIITSYRRKKQLFELYHEERMAAISKGIDVPPLPEALLSEGPERRRSPHEVLRSGLIWLFTGIALYFALPAFWFKEGIQMVGLIPAAIGLANLVYYFFAGRHTPAEPPKNPETRPTPIA